MIAPPQITNDEQLIITAFARNLQGGGAGVLSFAQLTSLKPDSREALGKAVWQLCDRGWMVVKPHLPSRDRNECVLIGDGLKLAKDMRPGGAE
jgi:hypothetical protein